MFYNVHPLTSRYRQGNLGPCAHPSRPYRGSGRDLRIAVKRSQVVTRTSSDIMGRLGSTRYKSSKSSDGIVDNVYDVAPGGPREY